MEKSVVEEMKYEEGKDNLSEAQIQAIADEAMKEVTDGQDGQEDNWHNPAEENKTGEEQRAEAKAAEDKKKEDEAKAAEDQNKIDDEAAAKAAEEAKAAEDKKKEEAAAGNTDGQKKVEDKPFVIENRQKAIEELALKESLTLEEAEEQIVKDEATVNKYKNNPVELARALRQVQSYADKTKAELEATRKAADKPPAPVLNNIKDYVENQLEPIKDKVIASFRKEYPEICDGHEDTFVYGLIKKDAIDRTMKVLEENKSQLTVAAKEKRANLILNLSDQDKAYLPDVKAILDRTSDRQLMDKTFDIKDVIYWAKGKQAEKREKEADERGFKRGQEQAKILGEKLPGNKTPPPAGGAKKPTLNDEQKQRALDMFDVIGMSEQDKYDAYIDTYSEEFKKR